MFLNNNEFTGPIPAVLSSLNSLERLDLSSNNFSGEVSVSLNNLTQLSYLFLQYNNLSGTLPQDLNFTNLKQFNISYNSELSGQIPLSLRKFPASAFIGTKLCGEPLGPCPSGPSPSPSPPSPGGPTPNPSSSSNKLSAGAIVGIVIGCVVAVSVLLFLLVILFRKGQNDNQRAQRKAPVTDQTAGSTVIQSRPASQLNPASGAQSDHIPKVALYSSTTASLSTVPAVPAMPMAVPTRRKLAFFRKGQVSKFDLEQLLRASAEVLGKGTFGTTYKAMLESGDMVAVKRLREVYLPEKEFREKVARVGESEHNNIVPLLAYYFSKDERLLVYDFMPMGSLSAVLHGKSHYKISEFIFLINLSLTRNLVILWVCKKKIMG